MSKLNSYFIAAVCLVGAALALSMLAGVAHAKGGYLHLREANAMARAVQAKSGGHTSLSPCVRVDSHHADCKLTARSAQTYCQFTIHVSKSFTDRRYHWKATTSSGDCEFVGA